MAASNTTSLAFTVRRQTPELVAPAKPTPHELKPLSDIDDQIGLRFQIPVILFYPNNPSAGKTDPVKVIREAIAKALVFYYPVAGRLREGPGNKLSVECTGEGVLFIEADADVTLNQFGDQLQPPFPCMDELLYDVPGSGGDVDCPLILIQVTRLACGGFIVAARHTHTLFDAPGLIQFLKAVGEIARGASSPSVLPVWRREVLSARDPPRVTCRHHEYSGPPDPITPPDNLVHRSFFFSNKNIATLRNLVPHNLRKCSVFELLTACLWRCRTAALQPDPEEEVRIMLVVSARGKFEPDLPVGYYGNAIAFPVAISPAGKLCENPLGYALELVMKAKGEVNEDYLRSVADLMVTSGRPQVRATRTTFLVSDVTRSGFGVVDFGWGTPVFGGPAKSGVGPFPFMASFYVPLTNKKGERGIVVPFCLPAPAMERFAKELDALLNSTFIASAL